MGRPSVSSDLRRLAQRGYSFVALVVALVVMNIAVAAVMPLWSKVVQRGKEEELIFRGLQYAEAIRVFQARFSRPPTSLEELLEVEPRSIRQLWTEPLSDSGKWEPILTGSGTDVTKLAEGQSSSSGDDDPFGERFGRRDDESPGASSSFAESSAESQIGPIEGVRPTATGEAIKVFLGQSEYRDWEFRAQMLSTPNVNAEGAPLTPRLDPSALGRPFPDGLRGAPGSVPHAVPGASDPFAASKKDGG